MSHIQRRNIESIPPPFQIQFTGYTEIFTYAHHHPRFPTFCGTTINYGGKGEELGKEPNYTTRE